jgi:hypothetical protein
MQDVLQRAANPWRVPKLEKIVQQLSALARRQKQAPAGPQTVGDDAPVPADRQAAIVHDEDLVRQVLGLFGIDYDALIVMDGKSCYSQALAARPDLAAQVLAADRPVVAALRVALDYKPYAEFAAKYGHTPEEIKANMAKELQAAAPKSGTEPAPRVAVAPPFSTVTASREPGTAKRRNDLASLFGR